MQKTTFIIMLLYLVFTWDTGWAQLSTEQEKRLKQLETKEETQKIWEFKNEDTQYEVNKPELVESLQKTKDTTKKKDYEEAQFDGSTGRYQAIRMDSNAVFILDTQKGHIWVWVIQKDKTGEPAEFLFYQGRVVPGSKMGELIDRTNKK